MLVTVANGMTGRVRTVRRDGRTYLVAPVTMITPGVLPGSMGPLLYTPQEVLNNVSRWNNTPLVLNHPQSANGDFVSASTPGVLEKVGIGFVANSRSENGKLRADAWFDVEKVRRVDSRILTWLRAGKVIEVSTGLTADFVKVAGGEHNGRAYTHLVKNMVPDHLAVLPDTRGACSVSDGCGVLANRVVEGAVNKKTIWERLGEALGIIANEPSFDDIEEQLKEKLRERFSPNPGLNDPAGMGISPMAHCYVEDVYGTFVVYELGDKTYKLGYSIDPETDEVVLDSGSPTEVEEVTTYEPVANGVDVVNPYPNEHAARVHAPGDFMADSFRRKTITDGVSAIFAKKSKDGPMMIQSYRFDARKFTSAEAKAWLKKHQVAHMGFEAATKMMASNATKTVGGEQLPASAFAYVPDPSMPSTWKLRIDDATHVGGAIAAIGKGFRGQHADIPASAMPGVRARIRAAWKRFHPGMSSDEMPEVIRNENDFNNPYEVHNTMLTPDQKRAIVANLLGNCGCQVQTPWKGKDEAALNALSDDVLSAYDEMRQSLSPVLNSYDGFTDVQGYRHLYNQNTRQWVVLPPIPVTNANNPLPAPVPAPTQVNGVPVAQPVTNAVTVKPRTLQEWLDVAPPEGKAIWNQFQEELTRQKNSLIETLVGNVQSDSRDRLLAVYNAMGLEQLRVLAEAHAAPEPEPAPVPTVNYLGMGGTPVTRPAQANIEPLLTPVYNFGSRN